MPVYAYKLGCRCKICVDANTKRCKQTIAKGRKLAIVPETPDGCKFPMHKPYTGYQYGCRCGRCRNAQASQVSAFRVKRKARDEEFNRD